MTSENSRSVLATYRTSIKIACGFGIGFLTAHIDGARPKTILVSALIVCALMIIYHFVGLMIDRLRQPKRPHGN